MVWLDAPGEKVWLLLWQTTALAIFVTLLTSLPWFRRPRIAAALWLLVVLKTLIPPIFPSLPVPWVRLTDVHAPRLIAMPGKSIVQVDEWPSLPYENSPPPPLGPRLQWGLRHTAGEVRLIFGVWLAGVVIVLTTGVVRYMQARRLLQNALPLPDSLAAVLAPLLQAAHAERRVRLLSCEEPVSPQLGGLLRPIILLPSVILDDHDAVRAAVAHELAHWRRKDLWLSVVQCISLSLWWFHPLVWLANRRLSHAREICADAMAIQLLGCTGVEYAHNLMNVITRLVSREEAREPSHLVPVASDARHDLTAFRGRISSALDPLRETRPLAAFVAWSVWIGFALAVLPGSDWRNSTSVLRLGLFGARQSQCFNHQGPFEFVDAETGERRYFEMIIPVHHIYNVTWHEARTMAEQRRHGGRIGRLAIVDSAAKHQFLEQQLSPFLQRAAQPLYVADNLWIGLHRAHPDRQFRWIDGALLTESFWHPAEPNNSNAEEHWVHYWIRDGQFSWNDAASVDARRRADRFGFIVEY